VEEGQDPTIIQWAGNANRSKWGVKGWNQVRTQMEKSGGVRGSGKKRFFANITNPFSASTLETKGG